MPFEVEIIKALQSARNGFFDFFFDVYSYLGSLWIVAIACLLIFFLYSKKLGTLLAISEGFAYLTSFLIKHIVKRPRPFVNNVDIVNIGLEKGYSFPSGHLTATIGIAVFVLFICFSVFKNRGKIVSTILVVFYVLLMVLDRMYLGVHYLTDTLAGIAVGGLWASLLLLLFPLFSKLWDKTFGKLKQKASVEATNTNAEEKQVGGDTKQKAE